MDTCLRCNKRIRGKSHRDHIYGIGPFCGKCWGDGDKQYMKYKKVLYIAAKPHDEDDRPFVTFKPMSSERIRILRDQGYLILQTIIEFPEPFDDNPDHILPTSKAEEIKE